LIASPAGQESRIHFALTQAAHPARLEIFTRGVRVMDRLNRRSFLMISAAGVGAIPGMGTAFASTGLASIGRPHSTPFNLSNALNLRLFLQDRAAIGLAGLMSMEAAEGGFERYPAATLLLFPFKRYADGVTLPAFLPGRGGMDRPIATVAMTTLGLPPDEFLCHYVLNAPRQSFIGFELDAAISRGADKRPWHNNIELGDDTVAVRWTSANLNHPWFAGSRWIPDNEHGNAWRARIIAGVRRAAALAS
jgi:hypothetical protein